MSSVGGTTSMDLQTIVDCGMGGAGHRVKYPFGQKNQKKKDTGASLVAQWLGICLPMQGTRIRALVWEDPTCHGATGPVSHNC